MQTAKNKFHKFYQNVYDVNSLSIKQFWHEEAFLNLYSSTKFTHIFPYCVIYKSLISESIRSQNFAKKRFWLNSAFYGFWKDFGLKNAMSNVTDVSIISAALPRASGMYCRNTKDLVQSYILQYIAINVTKITLFTLNNILTTQEQVLNETVVYLFTSIRDHVLFSVL